MRFRLSPAFLEERLRYALRHTCEDCVHYDPCSAECVHGYPNAEHREKSLDDEGAELVFCKEFELI